MTLKPPRHFALLLSSSLVVNALALALPLMTMQVYDRILTNQSTDTLLVLSVGVIIAATIEFILRSCRSVVVGLNGAHFEHGAATSALKHLLETEPRAISHATPASLAQDIGAAGRLKDYYGGQMMVTLLIDVPFIFVFLGLEIYLAHWLVLVPVVVLAAFLAISFRQGMKLRDLMDKREQQDTQRYSFITDTLQSVHSVKALCLEAPMSRRFEEVQRESGIVNYTIGCMHGMAGSLSYGFGQIMSIAVICAGAPLAVDGKLSVGALIACVLLSGQIMQPLQRGLAMWIRFQDIALARARLDDVMALPQRKYVAESDITFNYGEIRLDRVRFGYPHAAPIIDGAELHVMPGQAISIQGASGSGKTTLLEMMAGIYQPDRGTIKVSGMEASSIPVEERGRFIAYLPMRGMILRGNIMDNLTGFNPQLRNEARVVADQLGIEEAVALLPSGYDTPLEGHMTDVISPGLKQRIAVARALIHKPRLILFDNADHSMDHESYVRIFEILARLKGKASLVLVSEDKNILSLADRRFMLHHGQLTRVIEEDDTSNLFPARGRA